MKGYKFILLSAVALMVGCGAEVDDVVEVQPSMTSKPVAEVAPVETLRGNSKDLAVRDVVIQSSPMFDPTYVEVPAGCSKEFLGIPDAEYVDENGEYPGYVDCSVDGVDYHFARIQFTYLDNESNSLIGVTESDTRYGYHGELHLPLDVSEWSTLGEAIAFYEGSEVGFGFYGDLNDPDGHMILWVLPVDYH